MSTPAKGRKRETSRTTIKSKNDAAPILRVKKGATLKEIYAAAHRAFTAGDLQKYTEDEECMPFQQVIDELEALDREDAKKRREKADHGRTN